MIKGTCWLLLRNKNTLRPKDRVLLQECSPPIGTWVVNVLKDALKHLERYSATLERLEAPGASGMAEPCAVIGSS